MLGADAQGPTLLDIIYLHLVFAGFSYPDDGAVKSHPGRLVILVQRAIVKPCYSDILKTLHIRRNARYQLLHQKSCDGCVAVREH